MATEDKVGGGCLCGAIRFGQRPSRIEVTAAFQNVEKTRWFGKFVWAVSHINSNFA